MGKYLVIVFIFLPLLNINDLVINDNYEFNNIRIEYGKYNQDGYLSIYDLENEEYINETIYDDGFIEEFIYLAEVDNNLFIIVCKRSFYLGEEKKINDYQLLKYNCLGELLDSYIIDDNYINFYNHHNHIILEDESNNYSYLNKDFQEESELKLKTDFIGNYNVQYQGEAFINNKFINSINLTYPGIYNIDIIDGDYQFSYVITLEPDIIVEGDSSNYNYYGEIKVYSFGDLYINNQPYQSGKSINQVGQYSLVVKGVNEYIKEFSFSIYPEIYYNNGIDSFILDNNKVINYPIRIYASIEQLYINNELYNNELINQPGIYTLGYEQNGISENIDFSIYPRVEGISNNKKYDKLEIYIFGKAYINDEEYSGKVSLNQPGNYTLKTYFDNQLYESYEFEIVSNNDNFNITSYIKYAFIILLAIGGLIFFWKK